MQPRMCSYAKAFRVLYFSEIVPEKNICSLLQELYALDVEAAEKSHYGTTSAHLPAETAISKLHVPRLPIYTVDDRV